ncbi:unnamed protein product [marine sediment metagenome]|uniref:PqqD family protein n=1 Tax=marine sediment metagenome TaxID=412755 RepID=X1J378_9ZZZZ
MTKPSTAVLPKARSTRLVVRELDSETVIYDRKSHKATCLNAFSAQVWRLCDGKRTVHDITEALAPADPAEGAVALTLKKLTKADLLTGSDPLAAHAVPAALSRRAVVHGALAATAAIPVVTTILVPTAAQAASCVPSGGTCSSSADCCPGLFCFFSFCDLSTPTCLPGCPPSP